MGASTPHGRQSARVEPSQAPGAVSAEMAGISPTEVLIGQTVGLTGPIGEVARDIVLGTQALVQSVNDAGGIHGRRLSLLTLDDGHDPARMVRNLSHLATVDRVFALLNATGIAPCPPGTPSVQAWSAPCLQGMSGAGLPRRPTLWHVLRARARHPAEAAVHAWQLWLSYQVAMRRLGAVELSPASLDAYLSVRLLTEAMRLCGPVLSRSRLIAAMEGLAGAALHSLPAGANARSHPVPAELQAATRERPLAN